MTEETSRGCHCNCSNSADLNQTPEPTAARHNGLGDVSINRANDSRHGGKAHNEDEFNSARPSVDDDRLGMNSAEPSTHLAEKHEE